MNIYKDVTLPKDVFCKLNFAPDSFFFQQCNLQLLSRRSMKSQCPRTIKELHKSRKCFNSLENELPSVNKLQSIRYVHLVFSLKRQELIHPFLYTISYENSVAFVVFPTIQVTYIFPNLIHFEIFLICDYYTYCSSGE